MRSLSLRCCSTYCASTPLRECASDDSADIVVRSAVLPSTIFRVLKRLYP